MSRPSASKRPASAPVYRTASATPASGTAKASSADFARAAEARPATTSAGTGNIGQDGQERSAAELETSHGTAPAEGEGTPSQGGAQAVSPAGHTEKALTAKSPKRSSTHTAPVEVDLKAVLPARPQSLVLIAPAPNAPSSKTAANGEASALTSAGDALTASPAKAVAVVAIVEAEHPGAARPQLQPIETVAASADILPTLYNKRGRLVMPPPLKGSREILLHQNQVADEDGLIRIQNDEDLEALRRKHALVALPASDALAVDERLPVNRRYCRPWAAIFLANLSRAHYSRFHTSLQVNSAVRTVEFQQRLLHTNGNAAPAEGDTASPHLTGQAVDLAKHGLSATEIAWLRGYLLPLVQQGKIDVEEEFQQACFHISIYKRYLPPAPPDRNIASVHRPSAVLATSE